VSLRARQACQWRPKGKSLELRREADPARSAKLSTGVNNILMRFVPPVPAPLTGSHDESMFSHAHNGLICIGPKCSVSEITPRLCCLFRAVKLGSYE